MWYPQYYNRCPTRTSTPRPTQPTDDDEVTPLPSSWWVTDVVEDLSLPSPIQAKPPPPVPTKARTSPMTAKENVNFCVTSVGRNRFLQKATGSFGGDDCRGAWPTPTPLPVGPGHLRGHR